MQRRALITGGSAGIGLAFAQALAQRGDNLVLCARDAQRLEAAAATLHDDYGVSVDFLVADLATDTGIAQVEQRLTCAEAPIDLLINNAGFGMSGSFLDADSAEHQRMVAVNVSAVLRLTHAALGAMVGRGHGGVLNVGSMAPTFPWIRPAATYAATKAFVNTFTEALAPTLEGTGVRISVVCPGYVRSEFHDRAGINMTKTPGILWLDAQSVVEEALAGLEAGHIITVPGRQYQAVALAARLAPRALTKKVASLVTRKTD